MTVSNHIKRTISSTVFVQSDPGVTWDHITDVRIGSFKDPWYFKLLNIPKPLRAEITKNGVGGQRIAFFDNGKRFIQSITAWREFKEYSFTFNPERNFVVGYFFDLSSGLFRILQGSYSLKKDKGRLALELKTTYSIHKSSHWWLALPVKFVLLVFQRYLLRSIKKNSEADAVQIK